MNENANPSPGGRTVPLALAPSPRLAWPQRVLRRVGSVWFGVTLLILIFTYSSIGSAFPPIRQGAPADWLGLEFLRFEKTEMEWFHWWPFQVMIALLCTAMIAATLRIRPSPINAGVWAIHTGIIILSISSAVYFARKIEGDAVIFHSRALVMVPGMSEPASMVIRPEAQMSVGTDAERYDLRVADLNPDYVIREGAAQGKQTTAIWLSVAPPGSAHRFARRLLLGYPELTEDYLIEGGSVVRAAERLEGRKLIDERLQVHLWYDPAEYFFLHDTSAVYARFSPEADWTELRVEGMPHYHEYVDEPESVNVAAGQKTPPVRPLDLVAEARSDEAGLAGVDLRVTGFVPYAESRVEWGAGGAHQNPMLSYRIRAPFAESQDHLLAEDPRQNQKRLPTGQAVRFRWARTGELEELIRKPVPRLVVTLTPEDDSGDSAENADSTDPAESGQGRAAQAEPVVRTILLSELQQQERVAVEGTDYELKLHRVVPGGTVGMHTPAGLFVQVSKPGAQFSRIVLEGRGDGGLDLDEQMNLSPQSGGEAISLEYIDPLEDRLTVIATDDSGTFDAVRTHPDGQFEHIQGRLGEPIVMASGLEFIAERILRSARQEIRPFIVPRTQRQPGSLVRQSASQARVQVRVGEWSQKVWLRHHDFAFPDAQRAQPGRFIHQPTQVALPDGRQLELLYSRWREPLPSPVALDRFVLKTYPGGDQPSDYISRVRFQENGDWSPVTQVRSNQPARHGDYWYFQSQYDPQTQSHTVLGVGNREAVGWMLGGTCLSIAGMLYAFYVKPVLLRRRKEQGAARRGAARPAPAPDGEPSEILESDVVLK